MSTQFTQFTARFTGTEGHILTQEAAELGAVAFAREEARAAPDFLDFFLSAREKKNRRRGVCERGGAAPDL